MFDDFRVAAAAAEFVLLAGALLILPVALFLRSLRTLASLAALAFAASLYLLAANYFWPSVLLVTLWACWLLYRRGRPNLFVREDQAALSRRGPEASSGRTRAVILTGATILIVAVLIGGWLFAFLPQLTRVVPILPADSPADALTVSRIALDFQTNATAALFAAPWLAMLAIGALRRRARG